MSKAQSVCIIGEVSLKNSFLGLGFDVEYYTSAKEFYQNHAFEFKGIYIINWELPGEPGIEVLSKIRKKDGVSPVFLLSKFSAIEDKIEALRRGADDYILKPFVLDEILLKTQGLLKKISLIESNNSGGILKLLPEAFSFIKDEKIVSLTKREFIIFECLYSKLGEPVSRQDLISQFSQESMTERNVDVHIFSVRKKVQAVDIEISTVWGMGYKLSLKKHSEF